MIQIPLTHGKVAIVDDCDAAQAIHKWFVKRDRHTWYAARNITAAPTIRKTLRLHREILGVGPGQCIDHVNGDGLDCRRSNLRLATQSQNQQNQGKNKRNKCGFKGVFQRKGTWYSHIRIDGRLVHLGCFRTPEDAARTYDEAARKHHGDFARLNFPLPTERAA